MGTSHPVAARALSAVGSDGSITQASSSSLLPDTDAMEAVRRGRPGVAADIAEIDG